MCPVPDTYGCELASGRSWRERGVDGDGHGWGRTKDLALIARDRGTGEADRQDRDRETMMVV